MSEEKMDGFYHDIHEVRECLVKAMKEQVDRGISNVNTKEMYDVVDIIKDLYEAEKYYHEARYYESVVEAMHEKSEESHSGEHMMGAEDRFSDSMDHIRSAWAMADQNFRKKMKADLQKFANEMTV